MRGGVIDIQSHPNHFTLSRFESFDFPSTINLDGFGLLVADKVRRLQFQANTHTINVIGQCQPLGIVRAIARVRLDLLWCAFSCCLT